MPVEKEVALHVCAKRFMYVGANVCTKYAQSAKRLGLMYAQSAKRRQSHVCAKRKAFRPKRKAFF